ncbi:MAG TPA: methylmalonyl Co-A mutase-associated GTPase MeaB [Chloroflexota bacterium]|nr:methylmalonyl Co-A mutase-associated GTPase MeaB [Chloroflexota bacterium]
MPRLDPDVSTLINRARAGDIRSRARLFSLVEDGGNPAATALATLAPWGGHARIIGITGPPGAGKSTLVGRLAREIRSRGQTVAILAVDPASPITGGAVLGDRIRMQDLHGDPGAYVRSISTRGALGGLARAVDGMVLVAEALGYDVVLVETVGAGQDEAAIIGVAPTVVVVEVPHLGDDVQSIKAGILEIADVFVVNKADHDGADQAAAMLRAMLSLAPPADGWRPPVLKTSALTGDGVPALLESIHQHQCFLEQSGRLAHWRNERAERQIFEAAQDNFLARLRSSVSAAQLQSLITDVASHRLSAEQAAEQLLDALDQQPMPRYNPTRQEDRFSGS